MTPRKILVGYDGSSDARRAARWALDEAARTGAPVEFCYAYNWPAYVPAAAMMPAPAVWPGGDTDQAITDMVEGVALSAAETHPTVTVSTVITRTPAVPTLTERSAGAGLIVLGSRGHSAVSDLLGGIRHARRQFPGALPGRGRARQDSRQRSRGGRRRRFPVRRDGPGLRGPASGRARSRLAGDPGLATARDRLERLPGCHRDGLRHRAALP